MLDLKAIYEPVQADLVKVRESLTSIADVDFRWLAEQLEHVVSGSGKGIRPALTLLAGKFYGYELQYLLPMAVSVELMHTATLVHDDAIDKSDVRRGRSTVNKLWGEEAAVLLGDYLFAKAGEFVSDTQSPRVIKLFSQTLATISRGELNQLLDTFRLEQTRERYLQRISYKTAALFALSTESGAILSRAPEESVGILRDYGFDLGVAFQIVDDILDFTGTEESLGKPVGSDLAHGTLTLPAMLIMERYPGDNPVKMVFENHDAEKNLKAAIELVRTTSIADDCYAKAGEFCAKACARLDRLPDIESRKSLCGLADYVLRRTN